MYCSGKLVKISLHFKSTMWRHSDFTELVAAGYRPGATRIGVNEIIVSISLSAFRLAESVPPRALVAWDPRLLSTSQHLTLVILGIHNQYPVLAEDGTLSQDAKSRGTNKLTFKVGLTSGYKPDKDQLAELSRAYALQVSQPHEPTAEQAEELSCLFDEEPENTLPDMLANEPSTSDKSFHFGLSTSLEALFNDRFLDLLRLRIKYSIGWAAAETILSKMHRLQRAPEDIIQDFGLVSLDVECASSCTHIVSAFTGDLAG
jgi:ubiquitin-conjugating enzyme E2 Q